MSLSLVTNGRAKSSKEMLWKHPDPYATQMAWFMHHVNQKHKLGLLTYDELYKWSIDEIGDFWSEIWDFSGIVASKDPIEVSMGHVLSDSGEALLTNGRLYLNMLHCFPDRTSLLVRN